MMRRIRSAALVLVAVAVVVAVAGCADKTHGSSGTLTLTEPGHGGSFGAIGNVNIQNGVTPGNGAAFTTSLQDSSNKTVGAIYVFCIATQPPSSKTLDGTCSGTATVPGGGFALNVGGKNVVGGNNGASGAIVGGTGKYTGATGTFTTKPSSSANNAPSTDTFSYTLP